MALGKPLSRLRSMLPVESRVAASHAAIVGLMR